MNKQVDPRIVSEIAELFDEMMQLFGGASDGSMVLLMSKFELTLPKLIALEMMKQEPQTVSSLKAELRLTAGAVSRMVDQMVHSKLVSRVEEAGDRRKKMLSLTAGGRRTVERLQQARRGNLTKSVSEFDPELVADFKAVIERVLKQLHERAAQSGRAAWKTAPKGHQHDGQDR